jgi:hyperosmotically inducible periplasmic protein
MARFLKSTLLGAVVLTALAGVSTQALAQTPAKYTLKDRVEFRLETNDTLKKYDIKVAVDDKGVATLSGDVATAAQKAQAETLAKVNGVTRVVNNITVDPDEDKTLAERTKSGLNKLGEKITDAWITTKVKWFFVGEDTLEGSNINADTTNGVVTLKGTVKTAAGKKRAVALAQGVDGVKRVVDQMTIGG